MAVLGKAFAAAVALSLLYLGSAGLADSARVEDPEEGYPVDVVSAEHRHARFAPAALAVHEIRASAEWTTTEVPSARMKLRLIGNEGPRSRFVELRPNPTDESVRGVFFDSSNRLLGHVYAWRPDASTLRIEFARSLLDGARAYRWSMKVFQPCEQESGSCTIEWDRVPDKGSVLHELGG